MVQYLLFIYILYTFPLFCVILIQTGKANDETINKRTKINIGFMPFLWTDFNQQRKQIMSWKFQLIEKVFRKKQNGKNRCGILFICMWHCAIGIRNHYRPRHAANIGAAIAVTRCCCRLSFIDAEIVATIVTVISKNHIATRTTIHLMVSGCGSCLSLTNILKVCKLCAFARVCVCVPYTPYCIWLSNIIESKFLHGTHRNTQTYTSTTTTHTKKREENVNYRLIKTVRSEALFYAFSSF